MHLRHLGSPAAVRSWVFCIRLSTWAASLRGRFRPWSKSSRKNPRTRYCPRLRKNRPDGLGLGGCRPG